jgi:K+-transporting ATPase ATPase B chain
MSSKRNYNSLFDKKLIAQALIASIKKLHPKDQLKNFVIFIVFLGSIWTTGIVISEGFSSAFNIQIAIWLWFTVIFANFAEALAEGRGKANEQTSLSCA